MTNNKFYKLGSVFCVLLLISACAASTPPPPKKTQLQIREFQTKVFEVDDQLMVMKAMINVLQDDGYIVENANVDLGLITASKETDVEDGWSKFFAQLGEGDQARWSKNLIIESSSNISQLGDRVKVRINFRGKVLDNQAGIVDVYSVEDENFYQDFFIKVDKAIYLQQQNI